jgi:hypothetical protein
MGTSSATWHDFAVTSRPAAEHLRDLARLRRVRDRIDRGYAQPVNAEALARGGSHVDRALQPSFPARLRRVALRAI